MHIQLLNHNKQTGNEVYVHSSVSVQAKHTYANSFYIIPLFFRRPTFHSCGIDAGFMRTVSHDYRRMPPAPAGFTQRLTAAVGFRSSRTTQPELCPVYQPTVYHTVNRSSCTFRANKSSAVHEMGDRLASIDMGQKGGCCAPFTGRDGSPLTCVLGRGIPPCQVPS